MNNWINGTSTCLLTLVHVFRPNNCYNYITNPFFVPISNRICNKIVWDSFSPLLTLVLIVHNNVFRPSGKIQFNFVLCESISLLWSQFWTCKSTGSSVIFKCLWEKHNCIFLASQSGSINNFACTIEKLLTHTSLTKMIISCTLLDGHPTVIINYMVT